MMIDSLCVDTIHNIESNTLNMVDDISPSSIVVCTDENLYCDLQGEAVVLNIQSGIYFGLNTLGARIWELIQKPAKVSFVRDELVKEFDIHPANCEADLLVFLKQLQANALIMVQNTQGN
jgi:hypothetical protein